MDGNDRHRGSDAGQPVQVRGVLLLRVLQTARAHVRHLPQLRRLLEPLCIFMRVRRERLLEVRQQFRDFLSLGPRAWVRQSPRVRRVLEPPWIALLVLRQKWQELRQWARARAHAVKSHRLVGHRGPMHNAVGPAWVSTHAAGRAGVPGTLICMLRRSRLLVLRAAHSVVRTPILLARQLRGLRGKAMLYAIRNERKAIDWAYRRDRHPSRLKSLVGRMALAGANVFYRRAFRRFAQSGGGPLLPSSEFDPNHVMFIVGTLGPGGAERQVVTTLLGLKRATTLRLTLVCIFLEQEWQRFFLDTVRGAGIEVVQLDRTAPHAFPGDSAAQARFDAIFCALPPNLGDIKLYAAEILRRRPGVLHLWMDETSCKGGLAAVAAGVPRIVMSGRSVAPHHFAFFHQYQKEAYRTVLHRRGTSLLNNSRAGADDYAKWLGLAPGAIKVIHNGFHFEGLPSQMERAAARARFRVDHGWEAGTVVIGTIIRFTEEKRPALWMEAALALADEQPLVRFLLVGDGPLREPMQLLVRSRGRAANFVFTGYLRDTVTAILAMDVFLLTSRKEGFPNVLVEAQAIGVPVVAVDAGGAAETFVAGRSGLLVEHGDAPSLLRALRPLIGDPALRARLGAHAEQQVRERFNIDAMIKATLDAYQQPSLR